MTWRTADSSLKTVGGGPPPSRAEGGALELQSAPRGNPFPRRRGGQAPGAQQDLSSDRLWGEVEESPLAKGKCHHRMRKGSSQRDKDIRNGSSVGEQRGCFLTVSISFKDSSVWTAVTATHFGGLRCASESVSQQCTHWVGRQGSRVLPVKSHNVPRR